jgi:uncharacterized zinc-type alcohol dehydrogenase-like protein
LRWRAAASGTATSIINNEWGISTYPVVPGHEVIGRVVAMGPQARGVTIGQPVGVGWGVALSPMPFGRSKPLRPECSYHSAAQGGFADRLRVQWPWAIPLPEGLNTADAGPLLCGGTTVFTPLLVFGVKPTDRGSRGPDPRTRAGLDRLPMVLARR